MSPPLPEAADVRIDRNVMVAMRDGVRLAADIYRPLVGGGVVASPLPVLLERTPYDKRGVNGAERTAIAPTPLSKPETAVRLARAGYVVVLQDCRGRYASEGVFAKYLSEAEDGFDTMAWIVAQPWCDGRVGTFGLSYGAHVQSALASLDPPGLKAMLMDSGAFSSAFHSGIRQGGAFELKQATWAYKHALLSPETKADPARKAALEAEDIRAWFGRMPWAEGRSPIAAAPEYEAYLLDQWRSGLFDDSWRRSGLYARGAYERFTDAPMLFMTGWYDPYALSSVENYVGLAPIKRGPVRLIIGPWTHGQRSVSFAGDVDFGPDSLFDARFPPDFLAFRQAWFDHWLKGGADPLPQAVNIFVMGGGSGRRTVDGRLDHGGYWRSAETWPLPGTQEIAYHLHCHGLLDPTTPIEGEAWREYAHDPAHPVPTIGGATASGAPVMEAGAFDQREGPDVFGSATPYRALADRDDVLIFETAPLAEPVEVAGLIAAELWISSSAVDTDFTIKLVDVHPPSEDFPEGFAVNLAHGILRARYREGFDHETRLVPGEIYKLRIEGYPTANHFAAGHRIRLEVASSNFPHFDVNPNSGEPEGFGDHPTVALNRVYVDAQHPSRLWLPVVPSRREE